MDKRPNSEKYPEEWKFFREQARSIALEANLGHLGNYRIPKPDLSGDFLYAKEPDVLFMKLLQVWDNPTNPFKTPKPILKDFVDFLHVLPPG